MKQAVLSTVSRAVSIFSLLTVLFACLLTSPTFAEDWGAYALIPVSAPGMMLEAVGSGTTEGTIVSIGRPTGMANQKWIVTQKGNNLFSIRPAYSTTLVLAIEKGGKANGTQAVLETDKGEPWQLWALKKTENGTYNLIPSHAPGQGLDDFGGRQAPGSRQDLWDNNDRFFLDELLPFVAKEFHLKLSYCGDRIWKRTVKIHAIGAFSPWTPAHGTPL